MLPYYRIVLARFPGSDAVCYVDDEDYCLWLDPDAEPAERETALAAAVGQIQAERHATQLFSGLPDQPV